MERISDKPVDNNEIPGYTEADFEQEVQGAVEESIRYRLERGYINTEQAEKERADFVSDPVSYSTGFIANFATRVWPDKIKFAKEMIEEIRSKGETRPNQLKDFEQLNRVHEDAERLTDELGIRGDIDDIIAKSYDRNYEGGVDSMWCEHHVALKKLFIALRNLGYETKDLVS
jgi:hypothetical protein